ncbi:MAG: hypothetical protein E6Y25_05900 [Sneathia sanguinegens]|uniref:hypothetical protein n=1 Tax=Sneathia sanguinegens TaxID=40543 RepID=UPI002909FE1F|nr:hypothetical protein [Sneathia sanguinegens]MDU4652944.1 hypothetical protein [Sneathia sanguinegens]
MEDKDKIIKRKIELFEYKNKMIECNLKIPYEEIDLYKFFDMVFKREEELPFEDKKEKDEDFTTGKYNAICVEIGAYTKKVKDKDTGEEKEVFCSKNHVITKDLERLDEIYDCDFVITSPITYIGRTRNSNNARNCYGLAFDVDGVEEQQIEDILHQMKTGFIPTANIIVNSGNGVHLYYLFEKPISLFENIKYLLKDFKYQLTDIIWNSYTSNIKKKQFQGIFQGFRLPDTKTKFKEKVQAFASDKKYYTVSELNKFIKDPKKRLSEDDILTIENATYKRKRLSLKEAKEKYPDWYERRIVKGEKKGIWHIKRDLYDWWLRKCYSEEIHEGHRYFTLMALSMYALKCDISEEELLKDSYKLLEKMESLTTNEDNHFTEDDIKDSLNAFRENYRTFPRKDIEKLTGVSIPANKRNGRKQEVHLEIARATRDITQKINGTNWRENNGRKNKSHIIAIWRLKNPEGTKYACQKQTGLSKNTIKKWWNYTKTIYKDENFDFSKIDTSYLWKD